MWLPSHRGDAQLASDLLTTVIPITSSPLSLLNFQLPWGKKQTFRYVTYNNELIIPLTVVCFGLVFFEVWLSDGEVA